jgi:hypothetical protein
MHSEILAPVVALVAWTLVMLVWMLILRIPAMSKAGIDLNKLVGARGSDADKILPAAAQWKAHNYNHLHEQPTLFYAVALTLALLGQGHGLNLWLAWAYVLLRIGHSLIQATINRVAFRFVLFLLSTLVLVAMTLHAGLAVLHQQTAPAPIEAVATVVHD